MTNKDAFSPGETTTEITEASSNIPPTESTNAGECSPGESQETSAVLRRLSADETKLVEAASTDAEDGDLEAGESPTGRGPEAKACAGVVLGYGAGAAVDLHTGSIVFSDKGTLNSDTYQWLLAEEENGTRRKPCPAYCYTRLCIAKCYSITLGLALVSLIITVVMTVSSVPMLRAYQYTRLFTETNCSTTEAAYEGDWEPCECEQRKSSFPCVQIYVNISSDHVNTTSYLLRSNELDLFIGLKCSFKPVCNCDKEVNREKVVQFIKTYRHPGTTFSCLYNPESTSEIIRERTPAEVLQWVKLVLPGSALLLCLLVFMLVWLLRKNQIWSIKRSETEIRSGMK